MQESTSEHENKHMKIQAKANTYKEMQANASQCKQIHANTIKH